MTQPTMRIERDPEIGHSYLWLKLVEAVNLNVHCFHALVGRPLRIERDAPDQTVPLPAAAAYYLCGVTEPYRWELNSHVLALPDAHAEQPLTVFTPALCVTMWGLRAVDITDADLDPELYGHRKNYVTCRNLQAAWLLHRRHDFAHQGDRAPGLRRQQAQRAGVPEPLF